MGTGDTTAEFVRRCRHCGEPLSATSSFCSKCGATAEAPATGADPLREKVRALFGADLDLERELGRGGMGVVYAAFDPALQRRVAVKVLLPEIANDRSAADRFLREARTVASLQHPHVVAVYSVRSRDGVHAIVMQFVEGRSLDAVLHEGTGLPVHVAGMLLAQAADGLQHAHDRGVIHRDVKPANVLIDRDGRAIVSDFGLARREDGPRTTDTGLVVGTWAYMSPEQRTADAVTVATDQYALGVMAFELLTGRLPFTGTPSEMMRAHMHEPPPSLRALRPSVPVAVETVVHRMLAKDPAARYANLREAERVFRTLVPDEGQTTLQLAAFSHVRPREGSQVIAVVTRSASADAREPSPSPVQPPAAGPARRSRIGMFAGAGVGVVILGVAYALTRGDGATSQTPGASGHGAGAPAQSPASPNSAPPSNAPSGAPQSSSGAAVPDRDAGTGGVPPVTRSATGSAQPRGAGAGSAGSSQLPSRVAPSGNAVAPMPLAVTRPDSSAKTPAGAADVAQRQPDRVASTPPAATPSAPALPAASTADARKLGRAFVTMLNQRRYKELALVPQVGGDAAARAELLKLTETAADFAAGFDRVPSAPDAWAQGFQTECFVDLEWRGGKKVMRVRLYASPADGGWRLAGIAVDAAN